MVRNEIPQHIDAETALLGTVLYKPEMAHEIISKLKAGDFYSSRNRTVFEAISSLVAQNKDVSAITVNIESGGKVLISDLAQMLEQSNVVIPQQVDTYIGMVKEASIRRQIISFGKTAAYKALEGDSLDDLLNEVESSWFDITKDTAAEWEMNHSLILRHMGILEERYEKKGITGVSTGFPELDRVTGGWRPGQLIFVGAVPKMGKTSLGQHFALHCGAPVLFFTLEMLPEELADRQMSATGRIDGQSLKTGNLSEQEWAKIHEAKNKLAEIPIGWVKKTGMNVTEIKAVCRRFQQQHGLGLVVIDQLDKIREKPLSGEKKTDAIGRVTAALKAMTNELIVPVICLVQLLDKQVTKRTNPRPTYGDVRDSSCPDQDGDVVIYIWRPEFYWPHKSHFRGKAEIIVARQRSGPSSSVWVKWEPRFTSFDQLPYEQWLKEDDLRG